MEKEIADYFNGRYVKIERKRPSDVRPFKLFGTVEKITDNALLLKSKTQLGAILLDEIISIVEWED